MPAVCVVPSEILGLVELSSSEHYAAMLVLELMPLETCYPCIMHEPPLSSVQRNFT